MNTSSLDSGDVELLHIERSKRDVKKVLTHYMALLFEAYMTESLFAEPRFLFL